MMTRGSGITATADVCRGASGRTAGTRDSSQPRNNRPGGTETFRRWGILRPVPDDEQEARALELEAIDMRRHARWVRACGKYGMRCKVRLCPSCADLLCARHAGKVQQIMRAMTAPQLLRLNFYTRGVDDLARTLSEFRKALAKLRRHRCMRNVPLGVGALEMHITERGNRWNAHVHLTVDAPDGFDRREVRRAWRGIAGARGDIDFDDDVEEREALARYVTKRGGWCPEPGKYSFRQLEILQHALYGRQLVVEWGWRRHRRLAAIASKEAR
jgi:hypothetical protein